MNAGGCEKLCCWFKGHFFFELFIKCHSHNECFPRLPVLINVPLERLVFVSLKTDVAKFSGVTPCLKPIMLYLDSLHRLTAI